MHTHKSLTLAASVFLSLILCVPATAQISLDDVPTWQNNDRFFSSPNFLSNLVKQPSLSVNGFDCTGRCDEGLGLKQTLEKRYSGNASTKILEVYDEIRGLATGGATYYPNPTSENQVTRNTQVIQARAFMALASYVLEQNGINRPDLRDHSDYLTDLKSALKNPSQWRVDADLKNDAVKWTTTTMNTARTLDLYLALENAYEHYGDSSSLLLSEPNKQDVLAAYITSLQDLANLGEKVQIGGTTAYDVQPGNWPLKVYTALGYGALVTQLGGLPGSLDGSGALLQSFVDEALETSLQPAGTDRDHKFNYQTNDGNRFWAEGPYYFHYALGDVLPFWHAVRINGMLDYHPDFNAPDPFDSQQFTEPLDWLADLVTPDGLTPPLDDGNKHNMRFASVMRWTGDYGNSSLGEKYAWISDANSDNGFGATASLLPVEIAIPRVGLNGGTPPPSNVGKTRSQTGENQEQQHILRRSTSSGGCDQSDDSGDCHYMLLNGESGEAYSRGEGHEQPDQLQLLWYVNGLSVIQDPGYDSGGILNNSTWNAYNEHNVVSGPRFQSSSSGGLPSPDLNKEEKRKWINATGVSRIYREEIGDVTRLHGKQQLPEAFIRLDGGPAPATVWRDVLYIPGSQGTDEYVIDFSRGRWEDLGSIQECCQNEQLRVQYNINAASAHLNGFSQVENDPSQFMRFSQVDGSNRDLYMYSHAMETGFNSGSDGDLQVSPVTVEEENDDPETVQRVDIQSFSYYEQSWSVASLFHVSKQSPSNTPEDIWGNYSPISGGPATHGWVWKRDANEETYDVFVGREAWSCKSDDRKTFSLHDADPQYPDFQVEFPNNPNTSKNNCWGFARVQKNSSGNWHINPNYQLRLKRLKRVPLTVTLSGPTYLDEGEQGTWTATASPDGASYTWFVDQGNGWYQIGSGPSVSWGQDYISSTIIVDIKVEASKNDETASAQTSVTINNNDGGGGGGGCNAVGVNRICLAASGSSLVLGNIRADALDNGSAHVSWQTTGPDVPSEFAVQHRADSTATWSTLGTVPAGDSTSTDSSQAVIYRFETDKLEIGTHQFRVGLPQNAGSAPRAVGNSENGNVRRYTEPVTAEIAMDEAYRLSTYPNPVRKQATVELAVKKQQDVQVRLFDVLGRQIATLHDGPLPAQELRRLRVSVSATGLTSGTYFLRATGEDFADTKQITVVR